MKTILCYGDSNTFGFNPENGKRFDENSRWSGILKSKLKKFEIIEEGLNNRLGVAISQNGEEYSPILHLPKVIEKIKPDIIILAIGANDYQFQYSVDEFSFEIEYKKIIHFAKLKNIEVVIIPPPIIGDEILNSWFSSLFNEKSVEKSKKFNFIYKKIAQELNCKFFDFNDFIKPSNIDGLHYTKESHKLIAQNLKLFIEENFNHQA